MIKPIFILAAIASVSGATTASAAGGGVSPYAYEIGNIFGLPITNSMLTSWVISILLIIVIRLLAGKFRLLPSKGQIMVESLVIGIRDLIEPIVGKKMVRPTFWLLAGLFTFILINNWSGLLPGVGTVGHKQAIVEFQSVEQQQMFNAAAHGSAEQHAILEELKAQGRVDEHLNYFVRPASSDLNSTLALAAVAIIAWLYFIFRYAGPRAVFKDIFGNKADKNEVPTPIFYLLGVIFVGVGMIEVVSIMFRPISLSIRLYGNVFGGENLLTSMHGLFAYILPIPFYFLEVLIGFVQALVFTLLVAVYIGLICNHGEEEHEH